MAIISYQPLLLKTSIGYFRTYLFEVDSLTGNRLNVEIGDVLEFSTVVSKSVNTDPYDRVDIFNVVGKYNNYPTINTGGISSTNCGMHINFGSGTGYTLSSSGGIVNNMFRLETMVVWKYHDMYYYASLTIQHNYTTDPEYDYTLEPVDVSTSKLGYVIFTFTKGGSYGFGTSTSVISRDGITDIMGESEVGPTPGGSSDPYDPSGDGSGYSGAGGGSAPTGGTGTTGTGGLHDDTSDTIPTPSLPTDVTISSGLFTAYNPSTSQLASFANALWNMQVSDINDVLRFLFGGDAFNAVIGLHLLPVAPSTGGSQNIKLGNWDTNVSAPKISSQYAQVAFGSLLLPEYWGNCIDYAPYTKIQLALPYIGIVDVDTDDVLGSTNTLTYNIDVLSGAICATLHCVKFNLSSVIYQWSGACAVSLPFSGASYNSVLSAIAGVAAAGMGFAAMAAGPIGAALPAAALAAGGGAFGAGSAASIMGTMKGKVQKSGSFGANSGALGIMTPYFILTRPVQSVPASWQADKGYPSNISAQLGTVTGYTEVSEINLECSGTEAEKKEIIDLLKKGVLF